MPFIGKGWVVDVTTDALYIYCLSDFYDKLLYRLEESFGAPRMLADDKRQLHHCKKLKF